MKEIYPIGTVVKIQGLKQNIMICGLYMELIDQDKVFDYAAIDFPMGYSPDGNLHMFNNENILEVLHIGWGNDEHCVYVENLMLYHKEEDYQNESFDETEIFVEVQNINEPEYTEL